LDLLTSELTDAGLALLGAGLQHLVQLKLYQAGITDGGLHTFAGQPAGQALHRLVLFGLGHVHCLNSLGKIASIAFLHWQSPCLNFLWCKGPIADFESCKPMHGHQV